ncbi:BH3-interacting domain death agonist-like isoform X1 [Stegostoma tigrinum]|uniref:BH3-interacting domain death agonist-like isoform X1 n=1 Tax=Stegostoma tigrinum TaxID=3053191 RepID=UPI00202AE762|nr:BH3-interacting domain death agonist-like isoform X1 [Stegostoma tigrinum]
MGDLTLKTELIVDKLFEEEEEEDSLDVDSGGSQEDEVARNVAQCLRKLGDEYNAMIESHIKKLKPELNHLAKKQSMEIFSSMVTELSNNSEMQTYRQQLGFEMTLLKIAVTLGLGIVKESPSLLPAVKDVMVNFINSKLLSWVQRSGGWEKACSL